MSFDDVRGSSSEKKVARRAFDAALEAALAKTMAELKSKVNAVTKPAAMCEVEDYLRQQRRKISDVRLSLLTAYRRFRRSHPGRISGREPAFGFVARKAGGDPQVPCLAQAIGPRAITVASTRASALAAADRSF